MNTSVAKKASRAVRLLMMVLTAVLIFFFIKIICKLGHLCLILIVVETDEVEVVTSVTQTVDV